MRTRFFVAASVMALASGFAGAAGAEQRAPAPAGASQLEEVVVTARRREERLQDVPVAVTAVTAQQLARANVQTLSDVQRLVPSLTMTLSNARSGSAAITLRGQRQSDLTITFDPSVGIYNNEVYIPRGQGVDTAAYDLESVQVLKGPQGTLFGRNTTGGALLITTRTPGREFGGYVRPYLETPLGAGFQGAVNIPLTDWASLRLAGNYQYRQGYTKVVNLGMRQDDRNRWAGRASLDLHPNDDFKSTFIVSGFKLREGGVGVYPLAYNPGLSGNAAITNGVRAVGYPAAFAAGQSLGWHETAASLEPASRMKTFSISNTTTYHISDTLLFKNIIGYATVHGYDRQDQDGTTANVICNCMSLTDMKNFSEEAQLQGTNGPLEWVAGAYYFNESGYDYVATYTLKAPYIGTFTNNYYWGRNTSKSLFANGSYTLPFEQRTRIYAGVRYTEDTREVDFRGRAVTPLNNVNLNPGPDIPATYVCTAVGSPVAGPCSLRKAADFHALTWNVGADYQFAPDSLLYFTVSKGYRSGGFNGRATSILTQEPFRPEKITNYELGLKSQFEVGNMRAGFNGAAYYSDYKDIQRSITRLATLPNGVNSTVTLFTNAASATVKGGEIEAWLQVIPELRLRARYSYTRARYQEFFLFNPATGRNDLDASGNRFAGVAPNQGGLGLDWDIASLDQGSTLRLSADLSYTDPFQLIDLNVPGAKTDTNWLVDTQLVWDRPMGTRMTATLYMRNLLDEKYRSGGLALGSALEVNTTYHGAPRVVGVSLNVPFGAE